MKTASDIAALTGTYVGVPYPTMPLYWDRRLPVVANLNAVKHRMRQHTPRLPTGAVFDEASVLVPNAASREVLVKELLLSSWRVFNTAADIVFTNPFGTRYTVEYTFLAHRRESWRLEVMMLGEQARDGQAGFSPLHQALWAPNGANPNWAEWAELPVPHLSFKVPTGMKYGQATDHLQRQGFIHAQTCQSTYGHFGYYLHRDAVRQIYVKPRVNTRDAS